MNDRVLILSCETSDVEMLESELMSSGYEVFVAENNVDAMRLAREAAPDVILVDEAASHLSEYQIIKNLKSDSKTGLIPIVLLTAHNQEMDEKKEHESGADEFLMKPVTHVELISRVRSQIRLKKLQYELKKKTIFNLSGPIDRAESKPLKKVILLVEDDKFVANQICRLLNSEGFETLHTTEGKGFLELAKRTMPDIILLDLILPDAYGIDLLASLRENKETSEIPVIIVSAMDDLDVKVKGLDTGADDYLVKPLVPLELAARIRAALRKRNIHNKVIADLDEEFRQSITDELTGLFNRQYLRTVLERQIASFMRYRHTVSVMLIDIDHFSEVNNIAGIAAGDNILREIGALLKKIQRSTDIIARFGGEEIIVVLPDTDLMQAVRAAERIKSLVNEHPFVSITDEKICVSIGITEILPVDKTVEQIIGRADEAMYMAKREGCNRVRVITR